LTGEGRQVLGVSDQAITNTMYTRSTSNITKILDIKSYRVVSTQIKVNFDYIKVPKSIYSHKHLNIPDPRIGTLDLETYIDDGISKVYAIGFYTKQHGAKTFYIDQELNSNELVLRSIDCLLTAKYSGLTFYIHNMGRYDIVFLLKILINANSSHTEEKYRLNIFTKDDLILSLSIKANGHSIKLVDSYNILSHSLKDLGNTFELDIKKDIFPYKFVEREIVFYTGHKPGISFNDAKGYKLLTS